MSWRTVVIPKRCKLDLKIGYMEVRSDEVILLFTQTVIKHKINLLMIESHGYDKLCDEKRLTVDKDFCVF